MTGLGWPKIGTGGVRLWVRQWTFGFREMRGISWLAASQSAAQEGLCTMQQVSNTFTNNSDSVFFYNDARQSNMKTKTYEASSLFWRLWSLNVWCTHIWPYGHISELNYISVSSFLAFWTVVRPPRRYGPFSQWVPSNEGLSLPSTCSC